MAAVKLMEREDVCNVQDAAGDSVRNELAEKADLVVDVMQRGQADHAVEPAHRPGLGGIQNPLLAAEAGRQLVALDPAAAWDHGLQVAAPRRQIENGLAFDQRPPGEELLELAPPRLRISRHRPVIGLATRLEYVAVFQVHAAAAG